MTEHIASIAHDTLTRCIVNGGIVAGQGHFTQYWVRDSCFALWGALCLGNHDLAHSQLAMFENATRRDELPLRIGTLHIPHFLRHRMGRANPPPDIAPLYHDDKNHAPILDGAPIYLITSALTHLLSGSGPSIPHLRAVLQRIREKKRSGLLYQEPYADWADSIKKRGYGIYVNALYYGALITLSHLLDERKELLAEAREVKALIDERLWNGTYYNDFTNEHTTCKNFCVEGNLLALLFGMVKDERKLLTAIAMRDEILTQAGINVTPTYHPRHVSLRMRMLRMSAYHNGMRWLWIAGLARLVSRVIHAGWEHTIDASLTALLKNETAISEVYLKDTPYRNLLYQSEAPFAWSSGMLIAGYSDTLIDVFTTIHNT